MRPQGNQKAMQASVVFVLSSKRGLICRGTWAAESLVVDLERMREEFVRSEHEGGSLSATQGTGRQASGGCVLSLLRTAVWMRGPDRKGVGNGGISCETRGWGEGCGELQWWLRVGYGPVGPYHVMGYF